MGQLWYLYQLVPVLVNVLGSRCLPSCLYVANKEEKNSFSG